MLLTIWSGPYCLAPRAHRVPVYPTVFPHSYLPLSRRTISTTSSLAVASPRTAQPGCPPETISLSPCKALSPIYRALFKEAMRQAGRLGQIDPQAWTIPWNVHSQANHHGRSAFTYLAPYVFKVAISNRRIVALKDRTVTFTYRKAGSARPRTAPLDVMEFIRRFLQHVLPDGFHESPPLRLAPCELCRPARTLRLHDRAGPPHRGQAAPAHSPAPTHSLSDLWRIHAPCHAPVDLRQGVYRYKLSGRTLP